MSQSILQSFTESVSNIFIGYAVAVIAQVFIFPIYGIHVTPEENLEIGLWFTLVSLVRSFVLRRFFNWYHS